MIFLAWTKLCGELFRGKEVPIGGIGRIVDFLDETLELWLMSQGQNEHKTHDLSCRKSADDRRLPVDSRLTHVTRPQGLRLSQTRYAPHQHHRDQCCEGQSY